nr:nuclease domain-containing protein [Paraburkholderia sp. LEh10]
MADRKKREWQTSMKRRIKKPTVEEGSKYLAACRGEPCYLRIVGVCRLWAVDATVVPCHSNQAKHGKGMGKKAEHRFTVPGCARCHAWIDQGAASRAEKFDAWDLAFEWWEPIRAEKMAIQMKEAA